jgi:hypothetical protein
LAFGGLIAGEGCFTSVRMSPPYADGRARKRFVMSIEMCREDRPLLDALRDYLGFGSVSDVKARRDGWLPSSQLVVHSQRAHLAATIPFATRFLPPSKKRVQYLTWLKEFESYCRDHPSRWGRGPSICNVHGCSREVRARGLCRSHYYEATGN